MWCKQNHERQVNFAEVVITHRHYLSPLLPTANKGWKVIFCRVFWVPFMQFFPLLNNSLVPLLKKNLLFFQLDQLFVWIHLRDEGERWKAGSWKSLPAFHLHFAPQHCKEVTLSANKSLESEQLAAGEVWWHSFHNECVSSDYWSHLMLHMKRVNSVAA